jgi:transposase
MARSPGGLKAVEQPGPTPKLDDAQLGRLEVLLLKGAKHHGWHNQLWTAARVARLIEREFGIRYHPEHVRKILKTRLNWSSQKPRRKARERNDKEVARWVGDEFPRIVREAVRRQAHIVFLDESGFQLNPSVRRTLAPRGKTPVLEAWDRRDRISAISCVTLSPVRARPGLYFELLPVNRTVHAEEVVEFLRELRRQLRGPFTVVWDRHKIHSKAKAVKAYLAEHPEIVVEDLPDRIRTYHTSHLLIGSDDPTELVSMDEVEQRYIHHVLKVLGGIKPWQPAFSVSIARHCIANWSSTGWRSSRRESAHRTRSILPQGSSGDPSQRDRHPRILRETTAMLR